MDFNRLQNRIQDVNLSVARILAVRQTKEDTLNNLKRSLEQATTSIELYDEVLIFLQMIGDAARNAAKVELEHLVTNALQFIFGPTYSFKIEVRNTKRGPEAHFYVVTTAGDKEIITSLENSRGGGIIDIVSTALRFALLELSSPVSDGPIILDEPFKHVSEEFIDDAATLLRYMVDNSGRQIIMSTHQKRLAGIPEATSYLVTQKSGISKVETLIQR